MGGDALVGQLAKASVDAVDGGAARQQVFARGSPLRVVPAGLGDRAGAIGAALMAASSASSASSA